MKLGEALVKKGLITKEHLRLALERQVVFGGRIGTNIVELGIMKEEEFTKFLSAFTKVSYVEPSALLGIEEEVISSLSPGLAEKYKAIPFRKEKNRLYVAMLEPYRIHTVDEFRFVSGYDIIPYVVSELRLLYALEKYYGIKRDLRFISILDRETEEEPSAKKAGSDEAINKVKEAFTAISTRDEVAGILIDEAKKVAKRTSIFMVRGSTVTGWLGKGLTVNGFETNASIPSLFYDVLMKKTYYRGPVLNIPGNEELIEALGGTPQDSLCIPINIRDRTIALLYADNGNTHVLDANLSYINSLCQMASLSFELLIIKKKIMDL
jgi:hypothetical protein